MSDQYRIRKQWESWPVSGPAGSNSDWMFMPQVRRSFLGFEWWGNLWTGRGTDSFSEAEQAIESRRNPPQHPTIYYSK